MATITLNEYEIATLTDSIVDQTLLPWQFDGAQCTGPDFITLCSFKAELELGPDDAEFRSTVTIKAQCDSRHGMNKLYGVHIEGAGVLDALHILSMASTNTVIANTTNNP